MKITYLFHSCFIVETLHYILIFDYYKGELPAFDADKHIIFLVSHRHEDHYQKRIWDYTSLYPDVSYITDAAIKHKENVEGIQVHGNTAVQYQGMHIETLASTDEGVAFVVEADGFSLYHAGDLNWWHWEGEPEAENLWQDVTFHKEISVLKNRHFHAAFLPLDPRLEKQAWWGFLETLKICTVDHVFPMHFGTDIKKMQAYLHQKELLLYKDSIMVIDHSSQSFSFDNL